jgi:hypothetical protein
MNLNDKSPVPLWVVLVIGTVLLGAAIGFAQRTITLPQAPMTARATKVARQTTEPTATPKVSPERTPELTRTVASDWQTYRKRSMDST